MFIIRIYVYIRICMFIHTYINVYTYDKHTYTYIRIYTYMYLYTYLRKCRYIHTGQVQGGDVNKHAMENATPVCHLCIRIHVYTYVGIVLIDITQMCSHKHVVEYTHIRIYTYVYVCIYIHIRMCTYICSKK